MLELLAAAAAARGATLRALRPDDDDALIAAAEANGDDFDDGADGDGDDADGGSGLAPLDGAGSIGGRIAYMGEAEGDGGDGEARPRELPSGDGMEAALRASEDMRRQALHSLGDA